MPAILPFLILFFTVYSISLTIIYIFIPAILATIHVGGKSPFTLKKKRPGQLRLNPPEVSITFKNTKYPNQKRRKLLLTRATVANFSQIQPNPKSVIFWDLAKLVTPRKTRHRSTGDYTNSFMMHGPKHFFALEGDKVLLF